MATVSQAKMVRDNKLLLVDLTTAATYGSSGILVTDDLSTGLAGYRIVSTDASTMSTADGDLFVPFDQGDRIGFMVGWACTNIQDSTTVCLVVKANASTGPRAAWRGDLGDYVLTMSTAASTGPRLRKWMLGPFEDSRFGIVCDASSAAVGVAIGQKFAHLQLRIGAAASCSISQSGTSGTALKANVLPFRWPDVDYDT